MKNIFKVLLASQLLRSRKGREGCGCMSLFLIGLVLYFLFAGNILF